MKLKINVNKKKKINVEKNVIGSINLNSQKNIDGGFDSQAEMISYLRKMEHSSDPEESAKAKSILDELWRKKCCCYKKEL